MNFKLNFKTILFSICFVFILFSQDFHQGPYGENYFDIAAPFSLSDLNSVVLCDINEDELLNIQDIILIVNSILGIIIFDESQFEAADLYPDNLINVTDIIIAISYIVEGIGPVWDFEENWNGQETYIFVHYSSGVANSSALWNSNTKEDLLENSPLNVHYFFLSNGNNPEQHVIDLKEEFDNIISTFSFELQYYWNKHLHFINVRSSSLDNWIGNILADKYSFAIDRFQQIREVGYLGNPASLSGTNMSYLAHEAVYLNYEWEKFNSDSQDYYELNIFDQQIYSGGWASTISQIVDFPTEMELSNYSGLAIDLLRGCPDMNQNYSDHACDDYDRIAHFYICQGSCYESLEYPLTEDVCNQLGYYWTENNLCIEKNYIDGYTIDSCSEMEFDWEMNYNCYESARWITPFDRQPHHLTQIDPIMSHIYPGGQKLIKYQESGWPNSLLTLKLRFYENQDSAILKPKEFIPIWNGTVHFNPDYSENRPPVSFFVPPYAEKVEFVSYITGHGWGDMSCYNCSEFCNSRHMFEINGGILDFSTEFPDAGSGNHCMSLDMIAEGTIPNQYGTWGYGRAGWCPGLDVDPIVTDITSGIIIGQENIIDYDACRVSGASCITPPTCGTCGYCPEIAMSSYVVIYY